MALKEGEVYRCPEPECGCEVTVTRGAAPGKGGNLNPRCCCGKEMVRKYSDGAGTRVLLPLSFQRLRASRELEPNLVILEVRDAR